MPDNWGFVAAAYAVTTVVLGLYWRHLVRKERRLLNTTPSTTSSGERSREPSRAGHPRSEPSSRHSLQ